MSKYGTIPTSASFSDPAPEPEGSSSPLDFLSRAKARGASVLATPPSWRELADPRALAVPQGLADAYSRARDSLPGGLADAPRRARAGLARLAAGYFVPRGLAGACRRARGNLARFAARYALAVLAVVFLALLWRPASLLVFLPCAVAWLLVLYLLRKEPLAAVGRRVGDGVVIALLTALTLIVVLLLAGATANVLVSLPVGLIVVLAHAVLHRPADSIDDEVGP
ncbi:hypothetical protein ACP4OV_016055 [Aristida adscensionis]